jgi:GGDEF domain-containing protein
MMSLSQRLTAVFVAAAATVTAGALLIGFRVVEAPFASRLVIHDVSGILLLASLAAAAGVIAIGRMSALRVRVGDGNVRLAWGEAAIIIVCAWLPPALVPAAVLLGVAVGQAVLSRLGASRRRDFLAFNVAGLTIAGAAAALVVTAIYPAYYAGLDLPALIALCVGAVTYLLVGVFSVTLQVVAAHGGRVGATFVDLLTSKLVMSSGNIAVGLLALWIGHTDLRLLVLLPPLFLLLHQFYGRRLRSSDDRLAWHEFAEATRRLNRLDERDAVAAGIAGAVRLFRASAAEIVVEATNGPARVYTGDRNGEVREVSAQRGDMADAVSRPLLVRQARIGELRLLGVASMRQRDRLMLAAYGDALAAAVHDAVTHNELRTMSERTTYDAVHDPLTGLVNRAALLTRGNNALRRLDGAAVVALLLLDIDRFREVNNALGHTAGDELLQVIARRVSDSAGLGDLLARLGGDEFALLVTDLPGAAATGHETVGGAVDPPSGNPGADDPPSGNPGADDPPSGNPGADDAAADHALATAMERAHKLGEPLVVPT